MTKCYDLREANRLRNIEWTGANEPLGYLWRGNELAGELGELADLLLDAHSVGAGGEAEVGSWLERVAEECSDGVICVDLLGMELDFPQLSLVSVGFPSMSDDRLAGLLLKHVGAVCNVLKKLEREARGWPGSRASKDDLFSPMVALMRTLAHIADRYGFDLAEATCKKFNGTSEKVGLVTRLMTYAKAPEPAPAHWLDDKTHGFKHN